MKYLLVALLSVYCFFNMSATRASALERDDVRTFIDAMSNKHGFSAAELNTVFQNVVFSDTVIQAISRPAETLPWYKYRPLFLESARIRLGVEFWRKHRAALAQAEEQFGVPAEIMIAIIGVETRYGNIKGKYAVINALSTLAFDYPKRSAFFLAELEQYLLLTREQGLDPLTLKGSYAGAMGIPQFVSSSYRSFAVDFDDDGLIDIWENPIDAIGSVGNYFKQHGWQKGGMIAEPAMVKGDKYKEIVSNELKPVHSVNELNQYDVTTKTHLLPTTMARLLVLENSNNNEFWLGFENFYVISRYNHSALYSMAVFQLAREIKSRYRKNSH
ncbi:MAG: Lytic murein transglycosylase B [Gammaproteobacteria bacterium]|nr:Lytic murein transglycosylase B [Gammaproteobacteria bacterium]